MFLVFLCKKKRPDTLHTWWLVSVLLSDQIRRDAFRVFLRDRGIDSRPFFVPMHQLPIYSRPLSLPVAEKLSRQGVNLPSYPDLSEKEVGYIAAQIKDFLSP